MLRAPGDAVGVARPIVFPLSGGPSVFTSTGPVLTAAQLADCRASIWYANVHTAAFPGGELRGQLAALPLPAVFGGSCAGSNGVRMQIAADRAACVGGSLRVDGHGALASALAIFDISFARDASGTTSLPAEFTSVGLPAPDCFFLVAPQVTVASLADAAGCAHQPIVIPLLPTLIGTRVFAQWYAFDAAANAFGLVSSNAIELAMQ